jgi:hypothetical protein
MMSKACSLVFAVLLLALAASVSFAEEPLPDYRLDGMVDPYAGATPAGMRFGDPGHTGTVQPPELAGPYAEGFCPTCRFGVNGAPWCDTCWSGPCMDWKLIGWYSSFHDHCAHGNGCGGCGRCCTRAQPCDCY